MRWFRWNKGIIALTGSLILASNCLGWGFYAHRMINEKAIYALPPEMFGFYKKNQDYLRIHAVDPDRRRYIDEKEGPRHYIDLDLILPGAINNFDQLDSDFPIYWKSAIDSFGEDSLNSIGILPWHLNFMLFKLTESFKEKDAYSILKLSAEIGHYAADGHVPLHTTENYNGQLTGQTGIHALWESRIPERYAEEYDFLIGKAHYLDHPQEEIWRVIVESHSYVEGVLSTEMKIRNESEPDQIYQTESQGRSVKRAFSDTYIQAYANLNNILVERRMKEASEFIASLWYTAWVNAGQPNLENLVSIDDNPAIESDEQDHER